MFKNIRYVYVYLNLKVSLVVQKHSCENLSHSPELLFSISDKMHQSLDLIGNENFENTLNHPQDFLFLPILVLSLNFVKPCLGMIPDITIEY